MINIGTIQLTDNSEIIFYVQTYNGKNYGYIRKFWLQRQTKKGVMAQVNNWEKIFDSLKSLPEDVEEAEEEEILNLKINEHKFIKVNIEQYKGSIYIDIRDYYKTEKYTGPSKKGVKIPYEYLSETKVFIEKMMVELQKWPEGALFNEEEVHESNDMKIRSNVQGVPDRYAKYFK